ncbi:transcription initiation factor IID TAF10 subunit [Parasitella parasitica]|nr:transcription initiation factor IID TAF10 subunit [Parasitella parasitica]
MNPSAPNNEQFIQQQSTDNLDVTMNDNEQIFSTPTEKIDKEKDMAELLMTMDSYTPIIPDAVIDYYLDKTGFDCDDARIKKLFALAAQKFVADIATDAFQINQVKQPSRAASKSNKEKKVVLTMDDLSSALTEYGLNVAKPEYYE